jgi:hypothetical protein
MTASAQHRAMPGVIPEGGRHRARRRIAGRAWTAPEGLPGSIRPLAFWLRPSPRSRRARIADLERRADRADERLTWLLKAPGEPEGPEERLWPPEGGPSSGRHGRPALPPRG